MTDARLQAELAESKNEIQRLRERLSVGTPTVHKDLSLISLVPKRSGSEPTKHVEKFSLTREASVRIGRRAPENTVELITLKLEASKVDDPANSRFNMGPKFQREGIEGHKFDPTLRIRPKVASEYYKCQGILPRDALHSEDGEGERETRQERETQAKAQDRAKPSRTLGFKLSCAITD